MNEERLRWRTNPAIIAQYFTGEDLPTDIDIHLKPNEACVVIEDGKITGVATAQRLTVNPKLGTLSRLLSKKEPFRSFLFVHTGPHEVLIKLGGRWSDGTEGKGAAGLKIRFNNDDLGRLLSFAADGKTSITLGDIASAVELEISQKFGSAHMGGTHPSSAKEDKDTATLLESGLRSISQTALTDIGAQLDRVWLSWVPSDHERVMGMRSELEVLAEHGRLIAARDNEMMQQQLDVEIRKLEANHQLLVAGKEYEAKADAAGDIARIRARAEKEKEQWNVMIQRSQLEEDHKDEKTLRDRQREKDGLHHDMDLDDLKRMREDKRREWIRQQEKTAQQHNNEMLKGTLDALRESEDED